MHLGSTFQLIIVMVWYGMVEVCEGAPLSMMLVFWGFFLV